MQDIVRVRVNVWEIFRWLERPEFVLVEGEYLDLGVGEAHGQDARVVRNLKQKEKEVKKRQFSDWAGAIYNI